jgi:hypothetical protein
VVISDVIMPDMDGFKLLELVGLEMDLPVISKYGCYLDLNVLYKNCVLFFSFGVHYLRNVSFIWSC